MSIVLSPFLRRLKYYSRTIKYIRSRPDCWIDGACFENRLGIWKYISTTVKTNKIRDWMFCWFEHSWCFSLHFILKSQNELKYFVLSMIKTTKKFACFQNQSIVWRGVLILFLVSCVSLQFNPCIVVECVCFFFMKLKILFKKRYAYSKYSNCWFVCGLFHPNQCFYFYVKIVIIYVCLCNIDI